jgi:hypothetical protein
VPDCKATLQVIIRGKVARLRHLLRWAQKLRWLGGCGI